LISPLVDMATAFMAAPMETDGWDIALRKLATHTHSARAQLVAFGHDHAIPLNIVTDAPPYWFEDFTGIDGGNPAINWRVACTGAALELAFEHDYDLARERLKSEIYDDFARRHDMVNGCQAVLSHDKSAFFGLATLRTAADGRTTEDQRASFAQAASFALTAVKMQLALEHQGARLITNAFDSMNIIVFLCDARGVVVARTDMAEAFLAKADCPLRCIGKRLTAIRPAEDHALQNGFAQVIGGSTGESPAIWFAGEHLLEGHVCTLFPLPRREWSFGSEPRVLAVVRPAGRTIGNDSAFLQHVMGLTPAEADVARLMGDGHSREEVARMRGTSTATVNAQLKSLFRKSDVDRETELAVLVNRLLNRRP